MRAGAQALYVGDGFGSGISGIWGELKRLEKLTGN
jgi:hypothetical protein